MKIDTLAYLIALNIEGGNESGYWDPDVGLLTTATKCRTNTPMIVPLPMGELRFRGPVNASVVEQWLSTTFLMYSGAQPGDGIRSHQSGKGYTLNVPQDTVIGVIRRGDYTYLFVAELHYTAKLASLEAIELNADGYLNIKDQVWVKRQTYGDYRMNREVTLG